MSIYKDLETLEELISDCFDPTTGEVLPQDSKAYEELKNELTVNGLERLAKVRANRMADIDGMKAEIERMKHSLVRYQNDLDFIEKYMLFIYNQSDKDKKGKVQAGTFTIGTRKSTQVVVNDDFSDDRFIKKVETQKIDKAAIKNALMAGETIQGATLQENQNLTVL